MSLMPHDVPGPLAEEQHVRLELKLRIIDLTARTALHRFVAATQGVVVPDRRPYRLVDVADAIVRSRPGQIDGDVRW